MPKEWKQNVRLIWMSACWLPIGFCVTAIVTHSMVDLAMYAIALSAIYLTAGPIMIVFGKIRDGYFALATLTGAAPAVLVSYAVCSIVTSGRNLHL